MTALATREEARSPSQGQQLTADQVALIKRTLMSSRRTPTDDELALFVHQCNRTGLDPFSDQIHAIYRWDSRSRDEKMKVQVSIHGLRLIADRTRAYAPGNEYWCGEDGVWRDVWMSDQPPVAARVSVRKLVGHQLIEFSVPALWREFAPRNKDGALTGLWPTKPALMLAKCSEALALRKAFPSETSGLYTAEEMAQADAEREDTIVANVKEAFDATEEPIPPSRTPESSTPGQRGYDDDAVKGTQPAPTNGAPPASEPVPIAQVEAADADEQITPEKAAQMLDYLKSIGTPESYWRVGLMTLGLDSLEQITNGQARTLMADARAKYKGE